MIVLGLETSADDTAVAVVEIESRRILGQALYTQAAEHARYGGIVPELASRAHQAHLARLTRDALAQAGMELAAVDAVAATVGPGLTTALAMGAAFGKTLALVAAKPFMGVNHIEGHALSPLLAEDQALAEAFLERQEPYLLLLVTGGHTQLVQVRGVGQYHLLGTTADDAAGECFDKVGAALGLAHPAGPRLAALARAGQPRAVALPHPRTAAPFGFSFSGLKTAARQLAEAGQVRPADLAAALEHTVAEVLSGRLRAVLQETGLKQAVVAGGVAANATIRAALQEACTAAGGRFTAPPAALCTDNGAMIAYTGGLRHLHGLPDGGGLAAPLRPRWPLDEMA